MKTKFILSGGYASRPNEENDKFFSEILNTKEKKLHILLVFFAKNIEEYEQKREKDIFQFNKNKGDKELSFEIADEENFIEQVKKANIVYLHGGKTLKVE